MPNSARKIYWLFFKLYALSLIFLPFVEKALALDEVLETYNSSQCLAMGNACTAAINGYASNYYNPAGVAAFTRKKWEVNAVVVEGNLGFKGIARATESQSFGAYRLFGRLKEKPGDYTYFNWATMPSFTIRGFSVSVLANYQFAAVSDGTTLDVDSRQDVVPTIGFAQLLAGNLLKIGVSGKWILRNQLKGTYSHDSLAALNDESFSSLYREGNGFGADIGFLFTLPTAYLPTIGVSWRDIFGTYFSPSHYLNSQSAGAPESIPQSFNVGFSFQPQFNRRLKATVSADYRHMELTALPFRKHLSLGLQLEDEKSLMFWFGLNQFYPTAGVGLRVKGGNIELGTYAQDVGVGSESLADRRIFFRYTISF